MSDVVGDIDSVFHHFAVDVANLFHSMFYGHEPRRVVSFLFFYSHDDKLFVFALLFFFVLLFFVLHFIYRRLFYLDFPTKELREERFLCDVCSTICVILASCDIT